MTGSPTAGRVDEQIALEDASHAEWRYGVDTQVNVRDRYGACAREPSPAGREAPLAAGRAAQVMGGTEVASRVGHPPPIKYPPPPLAPAPKGARAAAAAPALVRPGGPVVGPRLPLRT